MTVVAPSLMVIATFNVFSNINVLQTQFDERGWMSPYPDFNDTAHSGEELPRQIYRDSLNKEFF